MIFSVLLNNCAKLSGRKRWLCRQLFRGIAVAFVSAATAVTAHAQVKHVIAISVDGLRGDLLQSFLDATPAEFPNFVRLRDTGASTFNARCDYWISETVPNHVTMITGRPVFEPFPVGKWQHGISSNWPSPTATIHTGEYSSGDYKASVFDVVHDHGFSTALYLGKTTLEIIPRSYDRTRGALDTTGLDNGRAKIDFYNLQSSGTGTLISTLTNHIAGNLEAFTFLHIRDPDNSGHDFGWSAAEGPYRTAIKTVDGYLGSIFAALDARAALKGRVAIVLTSDHGGGVERIHNDASKAENYTIPFFVFAPGVQAGSDAYSLFENRANPGQTRPTYTAPAQPIRNGDIANLSMALLGLPKVPGAFMQPEFAPRLEVAIISSKPLVKWPDYLTSWELQISSNLKEGPWQTIGLGPKGGGYFTYTVNDGAPRRFFRLRRR